MSQWSAPQVHRFGDYSEEFMMLWGLALAEARVHFPHIIMVTDSHGARLFENFPFDEMHVDLDQPFIPATAQKCWAAGKFMGFRRAIEHGGPFVNFDGDVILRKFQRAFHAPIFAQCEERFDRKIQGKVNDNLRNIYLYGGCARLPYLPACARFSLTREVHTPYNMGVCGGSDLAFWEEYSDMALKILRHPLNQRFLAEMPGVCSSLFIEQYLIGALADKLGKYISTLFPLAAAGNEQVMEDIGYIHLLGDSKYKQPVIEMVYKKTQRLYPWLFDCVKALNLPRNLKMQVKDRPYYTSAGVPCSS